ncbi:hypothetical protein [Mesorhizobium sp. IMUNJ 23232]|uniref:hypothetical protein n=1 Tax=Mesorhizobium sp. IMUNJ 23232 TaxID=3376064 RepID=UPI00378BEBC7
MTLAGYRLACVSLCALVMSACQSSDKSPQPRFVSAFAGPNAPASVLTAPAQPQEMASDAAQRVDKGYFIEFRSRYALSYGHTYVVFGRTNSAGAMINPEVAGLHPASTSNMPYVLGHFVPVPAETGWSDGDLEEEYRSASWRVMLTAAEYKDVVASIRKIQASSRTWQASVYNCNAFVASIAQSMGYKTPGIWLRPQQFVTKLREMNTG